MDTDEQSAEVGRYATRNSDVITNALWVYADRMEAAAAETQAEYAAGQHSVQQRQAQDASLITNNGYRQMTAVFTESARTARTVAHQLTHLIEGHDRDTEHSANEPGGSRDA